MYHALLSTASPNPGVSTTVSLSFTPFSSISTVVASMLTVCEMRSAEEVAKQDLIVLVTGWRIVITYQWLEDYSCHQRNW